MTAIKLTASVRQPNRIASRVRRETFPSRDFRRPTKPAGAAPAEAFGADLGVPEAEPFFCGLRSIAVRLRKAFSSRPSWPTSFARNVPRKSRCSQFFFRDSVFCAFVPIFDAAWPIDDCLAPIRRDEQKQRSISRNTMLRPSAIALLGRSTRNVDQFSSHERGINRDETNRAGFVHELPRRCQCVVRCAAA